jgi:hypothetical protein
MSAWILLTSVGRVERRPGSERNEPAQVRPAVQRQRQDIVEQIDVARSKVVNHKKDRAVGSRRETGGCILGTNSGRGV